MCCPCGGLQWKLPRRVDTLLRTCRLQRADRDIIMYTGIAQALLAAWAVLLSVTAGTQPIIAAACVGAGGNIMKLYRIFPPPASGGVDGPGDEKKQGAPAAPPQPVVLPCHAGRAARTACKFSHLALSSSCCEETLCGCAGVKNIMRGALLATAATFLGCALFFTLPDLVAAQLNKAMPYWFYESEVCCSRSACLSTASPSVRHLQAVGFRCTNGCLKMHN